LNGEANRVRKKHNRAIIAGNSVGLINKDEVLGTHRGGFHIDDHCVLDVDQEEREPFASPR
jgi:hypothetical protein